MLLHAINSMPVSNYNYSKHTSSTDMTKYCDKNWKCYLTLNLLYPKQYFINFFILTASVCKFVVNRKKLVIKEDSFVVRNIQPIRPLMVQLWSGAY